MGIGGLNDLQEECGIDGCLVDLQQELQHKRDALTGFSRQSDDVTFETKSQS